MEPLLILEAFSKRGRLGERSRVLTWNLGCKVITDRYPLAAKQNLSYRSFWMVLLCQTITTWALDLSVRLSKKKSLFLPPCSRKTFFYESYWSVWFCVEYLMIRSEWMTKRIIIPHERLQATICPKVTMPVWLQAVLFALFLHFDILNFLKK